MRARIDLIAAAIALLIGGSLTFWLYQRADAFGAVAGSAFTVYLLVASTYLSATWAAKRSETSSGAH